MSRSFKYDIALNEQIRNRLFSFFEKIFELSNSDQFLLNWYGGYIENSKLDLIAGKYYSKSKLPLLIDDIFTGKLGVEFIIGDFFLQSIDTDYIYIESKNNLIDLFREYNLEYYDSIGRERASLDLFDE